MGKTKIEWTDRVWNILRGCSKVSAGCQHCYAERMAARFSGPGLPYVGLTRGGRWTGRVRLVSEKLSEPLRWRKPSRVFVNSMSDLFHEAVPFDYVAAVFGVMAACPQHTFQVLTKRPERMMEWFRWTEALPYGSGNDWRDGAPVSGYLGEYAIRATDGQCNVWRNGDLPAWPLPNVWLGVSAEDQATADDRIRLLLQCPAAVRFVSCEPLLGPVDLTAISKPGQQSVSAHSLDHHGYCRGLDWIIAGGESGPGARPMHPNWARGLRDQCQEAEVLFFFKQWGEWAPGHAAMIVGEKMGRQMIEWPDGCVATRVGKRAAGRELDGRTWDEMPVSQVRVTDTRQPASDGATATE